MNSQRTQTQQSVISQLTQKFEIDEEKILFLNPNKPDEPWLSAEVLMSIARQSGGFQTIEESFDQYIPGLEQVAHTAIVVDKDGRVYKRSGVASLSETVGGDKPDVHALAGSRALNAVLTAAGFHPLRAASVVPLDTKREPHTLADEAASRAKDLKRIHAIAERKGLITEGTGGVKDMSPYRSWLMEHHGTTTAANLNPIQRASVINALGQWPDIDDETQIA